MGQGNGPWGARSFSFDRIGNRLTSTEAGEPNLTYTHAAPGHNPKLTQITPAPGLGSGSWSYNFDAAGNQVSIVEGPAQTTFHDVSNEGQLSALRTNAYPGRTDMRYDGRGYLRQANQTFTGSTDFTKVTPVYSSEGVIHSRTEQRQWTSHQDGGEDFSWTATHTETTHLFYFAGRPVAQLTNPGAELIYITTDHLGTPILATETTAQAVWAGGLEPFGRVWTAGDNPDPELDPLPSQAKSYATTNPLIVSDPLGLITVRCENCEEINRFLYRMIRVLNNLRTVGSPTAPGERLTRVAGTGCDDTPHGPEPYTIYFKFPFSTHPCIHTCVAEHERVHRKQCRRLGRERYDAMSQTEAELPAYQEALKCLKDAKKNGQLELGLGGVLY